MTAIIEYERTGVAAEIRAALGETLHHYGDTGYRVPIPELLDTLNRAGYIIVPKDRPYTPEHRVPSLFCAHGYRLDKSCPRCIEARV